MNIDEIKYKLQGQEYDFIRTNPHLGDNIAILGLGGSHAYGTNNEQSDLDIRGIATRTFRDLLTDNNFEQVVDTTTDTVIYSLDKAINLLKNCNPNMIEILGLKEEHYIKISKAGKMLLENKKLFLSKRAAHSFGGYANQQLRRLSNRSQTLGKRNKNAILHNKLGKHMMHLVRLYYMCFDILEQGEINTYRDKEHDLLLSIRNGLYINEDKQPTKEFYCFIQELEDRFKYATNNTSLPNSPDIEKIKELQFEINKLSLQQQI